MAVRLIALARMYHAGRWLDAGEKFDARSEQEADYLIKGKQARRASGSMGRQAGRYLHRQMRAKP